MRLCHIDELAVNAARGFDPWQDGWDAIFAVRHGDGVRVFRNCCPHERGPLPWRKDAFLSSDGRWIVCSAHGARFECETGRCIAGPCLGEYLEPVAFRIDPDGQITVLAASDKSKPI